VPLDARIHLLREARDQLEQMGQRRVVALESGKGLLHFPIHACEVFFRPSDGDTMRNTEDERDHDAGEDETRGDQQVDPAR
jgi:hypothetical protein